MTQQPRSTLWLTLGAFTVVLVLLLLLAGLTVYLLDATRAYTNAESLYTKGQKEAVIALQRFAGSQEPDDLEAYRRAIDAPLGDRAARLALERDPPDRESARQGFLRGGNVPEDIDAMIRLFLWFGETRLFRRPLQLWREADALIIEITEVARALEVEATADALPAAHRNQLLEDLTELNRRAGEVEAAFSVAVGESAREARDAFVVILVTTSLLFWLFFALFTRRLDRRRNAAERSLASSEERLRILMNSTGDGILGIDPDGRIHLANVAAGRLFRASPDQLRGRPVQGLVTPEDREQLDAAMQAAFAVSDTSQAPRVWRLRGRGCSDQSFPMEALCALEETESAERMVLTLRDVSERELAEEKLFQAQRMEAVGQLTAGIAHNFNNLLTVVIGSLEELESDLERRAADSGMHSLVHSGLQAAERGAELTSHLLAFARSQSLAPGPVAINALISDMQALFDRTVPGHIEIRSVPAPGELYASIDQAQLESALLNLLINARHAMPRGGRVTMETERRNLDTDAAIELDLAPGEYVVIRVADTGEGIAPEHLAHVAEPFFTTKDVDVGTGLGLSMVHGFVRQSRGQLRIESTVGEGTAIELLLPVAGEGSAQAQGIRG